MPTLLSAQPLSEAEIKETCRKWREQEAQQHPEMRAFVQPQPLWRRVFAKLLFQILMVRGK
jgi:hypothetical protein